MQIGAAIGAAAALVAIIGGTAGAVVYFAPRQAVEDMADDLRQEIGRNALDIAYANLDRAAFQANQFIIAGRQVPRHIRDAWHRACRQVQQQRGHCGVPPWQQ